MDLAEQLDRSLVEQNKYQTLLRELLEAQRNRKSEQLSKEQLALFEAAWQARDTESAADNDDDLDGDAGAASKPNATPKRGGRQPLARHLKRERLVHDLAEAEKHCHGCGKDLRLIAEETSERSAWPIHDRRRLTRDCWPLYAGGGDPRGQLARHDFDRYSCRERPVAACQHDDYALEFL